MVHFAVVEVIRIPGVTHQWAEDIREGLIEESVRFGENAIVVDVIVQHEREGADGPCYENQMEDAVEDVEARVEDDGAGHAGAEVEDGMRQEDNVCLAADDGSCPTNIRRQNILAEERREFGAEVGVVPGGGHGWVEGGGSWVVDGGELVDGGGVVRSAVCGDVRLFQGRCGRIGGCNVVEERFEDDEVLFREVGIHRSVHLDEMLSRAETEFVRSCKRRSDNCRKILSRNSSLKFDG